MKTPDQKTKPNKDGKMKRFYQHLTKKINEQELKVQAQAAGLLDDDLNLNLVGFENEETYKKIYEIMMKVNFLDFRPARGWPDELPISAGHLCPDDLVKFMDQAANDINNDETKNWVRNDPIKELKGELVELSTSYLDTGEESFCEYSPELGLWHKCKPQELISVNPRCDPRFWFYAEEIIYKNKDIFM